QGQACAQCDLLVNLNAYAERFVRTIKESCLEQVIFFGEDSLRNAIREFVAHYHLERNHQGLNNRLIVPVKSNSASSAQATTSRRTAQLLLPCGNMNSVFGYYAVAYSTRPLPSSTARCRAPS